MNVGEKLRGEGDVGGSAAGPRCGRYAAADPSLSGNFRYPAIQVQVRMGNGHEVMRWLGDAHVDAALASEPPADGAFSYEPLGCDLLMCAFPSEHPLAKLEGVPLRAFTQETLLLCERTSKTRAFIERALADACVEPRNVIELQSRETIREGIALGLGIGVFYKTECPPDSRIVYRPVDTGQREYQLRSYFVCQSQRRRDALMRVLQSMANEIRNSAHASNALDAGGSIPPEVNDRPQRTAPARLVSV